MYLGRRLSRYRKLKTQKRGRLKDMQRDYTRHAGINSCAITARVKAFEGCFTGADETFHGTETEE